MSIYSAFPGVESVYMRVNNTVSLCTCAYERHGELDGEGCCMDRNRGEKTDGTGNDVCLAGELNKIEAVL